MPALGDLRLAGRLFLRDWRAGELTLFAAAIVIAVGAVTATGFFSDRLHRAMTRQSADLLGGDLQVQSPQLLPAEWFAAAAHERLRHTETIEFSTVAVRGLSLIHI